MRKFSNAVLLSLTAMFCLFSTVFAAAQTTISTTTENFGNVVVNTTSAGTVTLKNTGTGSIAISTLAVTPGTPYAILPSSTCLNPTLAAGASCTVRLTFSPTIVGAPPASTLTITTTASNPTTTVTLTGTGIPPTAVSQTALNFGNVVVNQASVAQSVMLLNNQSTPLTITSITAPASYAVSSTTCGSTLVARGYCWISVTLRPTALGPVAAESLNIVTNAPNSPLTVALSGTGVAPVSLNSSSYSFGNVAIGATSATKNLMLLNYQNSNLTISSVIFNGPFALDTSAVTTCPVPGGLVSAPLVAGGYCYIGVVFQPTVAGATAGGQITVIDSASNSPQVAVLSGTGIVPVTVAPSTLAFGNVQTGTTSAPMTVTVRNYQAVNLDISAITVPALFAIVPASTTCLVGTPVLPGNNCVISVTFSPTSMGAAPTSTLTITDDATSSPQTVNLTGNGVGQVTLNHSGLAFGTVVVNNAVTENVTLTNNQATSITINSITGFPAAYTQGSVANSCTAGLVVPARGNCVIAVTLTATAAGAQPGKIYINDTATSSPQSFTVSANAITTLVAAPTSLTFSAQSVGTTSTGKTILLTNEQTTPLPISSITVTGANSSDFTVTTSCPTAPAALPAGASCPVQVTFTPGGSGARTASLNVNDPIVIPLSGAGSAPVTVLPGLLTFTAPVGSTSAYQTVTITNASANPVTFNVLQLSGDFIQTSSNCGAVPFVLAAGANCKVTLSFNPSIGGVRDGQLQVYDTAPTSPQVINLTGTGTWPLALSVSSLSFSAQTVNTSSSAKVITLTNHEVESETFSLGTTGDFSATSNCGSGIAIPIAANGSCLVYVTFTPSSVLPSTTRTGTLIVTDTAPGGPQPSISLTGSAVATKLPAAVAVVSPGAGAAGTSVNVVITGNGWTTFSPSSVISFTDINSGTYPVDITVTSQTFKSINEIDATFTIPANTVANPVTYGARNIAVTTPLSGGGTEVARLVQAFIIADPSNQHPISVVAPAFGTQGQASLNVNLTATGTNFDQGITYANFGDGITVNSLTVTDATDAQANITISNTTPVGGRTITLVTGGEFAVSTPGVFQIGPNAATLTGFTVATYSSATSSYTCTAAPAVEPQGWSGALCMSATGTHFLQDATQVSFTGGILVGDVTVTSPTTAIVQVAVQALATVGLQNATVWTGGEIASLNNAFAVTGATPLLLSVTPSSAPQGSSPTVVITGNAYMNFLAGPVSAYFDGNISSPTVNVIDAQHVSIPISISTDANVGSITANLIVGPVGSSVLYPFTFTVTQSSAAITSVAPSCVPQGGQLTLTVAAINTNWVQGTTTAGFYPVPVPAPSFDLINIIDATDATLNVAVPTNSPAGNYEFYMATGGQVVNASIKVCAATPSLTMSPANGLLPYGAAVNSFTANFTGQFTHFGPSAGQPIATEAVISGEGVTLTNFNVTGANSATATVTIIANVNGTPTATGPRKITFTTGGEIVKTYFNVTQTPVGILSVSPYHGPQSTTMNVELVGLNTHFTQPTTTVQFGPQITVNSVTVNSTTDLVANITTNFNDGGIIATPPGWQNVYVNSAAGTGFATAAGLPSTTSGAGTGALVSITASATGALTSCTAAAGGSGYQVGDFIYPTQAGSAGSACQVTAVDGTTAVTTMITVQEQVITGFLVDSPAMPSLVSVCVTGTGPLSTSAVPCNSSAQQGATVGVTITGSLTNWNSSTEAILGAGVTIANLTNTSPTTETATIAVSPTAPVGGNSVIMITGPQVLSGTGFNVTPGASLIYSIGPVGCNANQFVTADVCGVSNGAGTPYVVTQLHTYTLNIVGVGTHWLQGETIASFGSGVATDSLMITSPTTATVQITVLSTSPVGFASLTMTTDGEVTTLPQAIDIEEGFPKILATSPAGGEQGNNITLQVLGRFANWQQGATSAAFNQDITVNSVTVIDSNNLQLNITVSPWAYVDLYPWIDCGHVLTITTGTVQEAGTVGPSGTPGIFCVTQGAEEITNVTPLETIQGSTTSVTITGAATNFVAGVTQVSFGDPNFAIGEIQVNSLTSLTVPVAVSTSATPGFKTVTVSTYGQVAGQQFGFTVSPGVATLNEAIPNQAEQGAPIATSPTCSTLPYCTIRLIGQYSHFSDLSTATFGAGITVHSVTYMPAASTGPGTEVDAQITIDPLSYPGGRLVTVTTPGVSCANQPPIAVTGLVYQGCTPGVSTGTGSEIVSANIFTIIPGPAIISNVSPNTGNEGQEVVFNITGEATHWAQNFTQFYIGGAGYDLTVNSVTINSPTSATVDLSISPTANPGPRSVTMVTNGEVMTDRGAFVVTGGIPVVSYITPNNSLYSYTGLQVEVVGNAYTLWNASSTISFGPGITVSSFQVDDASHIEALLNIGPNCTSPGVPAGCAQLGYHTVIVQTGAQVLTSNFQVTPPPPPPSPYIWYESPSSGIPGQTLTINFIGRFTEWDPNPVYGTLLTGFNADVTVNTFQVLSPTTATANVTIAPDATESYSTLTFTTPNTVDYGTEVDYAGFTVVVAQPYLNVVDPGSSMQGSQNLTVNILGQFTAFDSSTTFNFGQGITLNGPPTILGPGIATQSISIDQLANLGYRGVVATTPDAPNINGVNQVTVGGAGFTVTPSLALIQAVTANTALQGQTPQVEITGQNTHWNGSTNFQFGDGIVVTKHQVNTPTDATVWLAIPAYAGEGPTWASATTAGEVANLNNAFVVQAGTPYLLSSGPGSEPQQSSSVFTILSQATQWLANPPTVSYGDGVVLTNVNVTGNTSLTVNGYVQPTTYTGWRNLTVSSGTQVLGLNSALYISSGPAVINNIVASSAGQGANLTVTINGTNTHWVQGVTQLTFPNVVINGMPTVVSPTQITANITVNLSAPAGQETVIATTLGEIATGVNVFDVIQTQPELLAVVGDSGASYGLNRAVQGWTGFVNLTGEYTHFTNSSVVNFGTGITVNSVSASSATALTVNITVSPIIQLGWHTVSVTSVGGTEVVTLSNAFQITVGPAAIVEALNPFNAPQKWSGNVLVVGSQTHFNGTGCSSTNPCTTAYFGPYINVTGITVTDAQHATVGITVQPNAPLQAYDVSLTTGGEVATGVGAFTVSGGAPSIIAINPPFGHLGDGDAPYYVEITGQYTHFNGTGCSAANPCSTASFGAGITVNSLQVNSATDIKASITISPIGTTGSRTISVTTGTETASMTGGFSVLPGVPALTTAIPNSGQAGTTVTVTINGQFTNFQQGFTSVTFGGGLPAPSIVTVNSLTQVQATLNIPSNATVGTSDITVTTNSTPLTLSGGFTVTPGTPVITQINPNIGNPGQTALSVTIIGQYTNWTAASTVTIGTPADGITVVGAAGPGLPGPVTFNSATSVTVSLNIAAGAPVGPAGVSVTTGGSTQSIPGGFTVQPVTIPAPSIISISPGMNAGGIPINSSFYVVFSQPMNIATFTASNAYLRLTSNPGGWITIPSSVSGDATGRVMTITPSSPLAVNSQYYLYLSSAIKDATGAAGNSINTYGQYFNTVFSAATTQPTVVAFNPPALSTVGTNVPIQLEFSVPMNQGTASGMTVTGPGGAVAGTFMWNSNPYCCGWGWNQPGNLLFYSPTAPLAANTTYTVAWGAPLADTEGNAVTPGSFTFTTGSGPDTTTNNVSAINFGNYQTNIGTNFAPQVVYSKPINPININTSTLQLYNADSGKYINGTVTVAPNGLSATFTPAVPLLPDTYYRLYQAWGYYDADGYTPNSTGAYINGGDWYFTTGNGADLVAPDVAAISPANTASGVPLNAQVIVHFDSPLDPDAVSNIITVTPSGSSAISGTASLASDLVTLFFVPTNVLAPATVYTVQVSGYQDMVGNVGTAFSSSFTTTTSIAPLNVSTGFNAGGQLITTNDTADANWVYIPQGGTPSESTFGCPSATTIPVYTPPTACTTGTASPLQTVGPGDADWWSNWPANGPNSDWITINPGSGTGNTKGLYYTTFNITESSVPANLCLVGQMGIDDNGLLAINGTAIMGNLNLYGDGGYRGGYQSLYPLNIPISSFLLPASSTNTNGTNVLSLGWGSTDNSLEAFRLQATIQTCGASLTGGTSLNGQGSKLVVTSATPSYSAGGVATNTTIQLVFNNPLDPATVNSTTLPVMVGWNGNQQIAGTYVISTTNVMNDTVTFTPFTPFPVNTQIWVGANNGPYDLAGDTAAYNGNYTQLTYFNTISANPSGTPAPSAFTVTAFTPANGATNVGLRAPVTATFNRSLNLNSVNQNDYALFNGDSQSPWCSGGSYSHSQDGTSISFNCGALPSSATLTAMLGSGLSDWNGDALTPYTSQFSTNYYDYNTHGSLITQRPGNGAGGVDPSLPIVLYFNYPINPANPGADIEVAQNNVAVPGTAQVLDGGFTLEFTPSVPWTPGALVQWWTTGNMTDTWYYASFNTYSGYFYVAADTSTLTPTVQVASPAENTYGVPLNTIFDVQFNTPLNPSTVGYVYLYDASNGNAMVPAAITQPQPNEIRLVPTSALPANHSIAVNIVATLQSTTSVPATATAWYEYTGTTSDSTTPLVTSAVPFNGATGVGVNVAPGVIFNKAIDPVSLNSSTFQVLNGATPLAGSYWFSSSDTRIEFIPNAPLPANTILTMTLNGVTDQVGNPISFSSSFTTGATPDVTAPSVVTTSIPSNGSVPTNASIVIQFSTSMDATTFSTGSSGDIYIYDAQFGGRVPATLSWNSSQTVAYLTPSSPLAAGRYYYIYVNSGTDLAGNQVNGWSSNFYAEFASASTAPTVVNFNPLSGMTGVGTNAIIEAQFSAAIDPNFLSGVTLTGGGAVNISTSMGWGNTLLQIIPAMPLAANTAYTLTIAGVKDPAGNTVATVTDSFTTGPTYDINAAVAVNIDPSNYATVGTNVTPKMVFNKPLNPIYASDGYFQLSLNDTGQRIPLTVTMSPDGKTVTLTPQEALLPNTEYRYYAGSGLQDENGNGVNNGWYYFYTGGGVATSSLTVTSVSPANTATGIPLNAQVHVVVGSPIEPAGTSPAATFTPTSEFNILEDTTNGWSFNVTAPVWVSSLGYFDSNSLGLLDNHTVGIFNNAGILLTSTVVPSGTAGTLIGSFNYSPIAPIELSPGTYYVLGTQQGSLGANPADPIAYEFSSLTTIPEINIVAGVASNGTPGTLTFANSGFGYMAYMGPNFLASATSPILPSIDPTSWSQNSIQLLNGATPVAGVVSQSNNQMLAFTPTNPLSAGTTYTVNVSGFADANGNAVTPFSSSFTTGTLASAGGLTFTGSNIGWGATVTNPVQPIVMTFSQALDPATVNSNTLQVMDTWNSNRGLAGTYTVGTGVNANQVTFTPASPYPSGAQIYVGECGGPTDILGEVFQNGSCYNQALVYFYAPTYTAGTVGDPTSLSVVSVSPANGATNVRHDLPVSVTFNNPIYNGSAGSYNTQLYAGQDLQTNGNVSWSVDGRTMTFNVGALYNGTTYTIAIPAGGLYDEWGNSLGTTYTSTFTTASNPATGNGSVQSTNPGNTSGVPTNNLLTLYMNRQVNASTVSNSSITVTVNGQVYLGTVAVTGGGYEIQYTPNAAFPTGATVQWWFAGSVQDVYGDLFNGTNGYFYTVSAPPDPTTGTPTVVATSPRCCGSTGVPTNTNVDIEFSLPIDPTTLNTSDVWINSGPATPYTVGLAPGTNNVVRITPTTPWTASTWYGFCTNGSVKGTNGVNAQSDCWATYFTVGTTTDTTAGTVKIGPPNGSPNVGTNAYIRLQFSKGVDVTTINSTNVAITTSGNPIPGSWSYSLSGSDVTGANFLPVNPLPPSSLITVNVSGVLDYVGNTFTAANASFTTAATPDYSSPSVSMDFNYWQYGVATNASFTCHYSEAMDPSSINDGNTYIQSYVNNAHVPVTYTWSTDLTSLTMTPVTPLFADSQYVYYCQSGIDLTGNGQNNNSAGFYTGNGPSSAGPTLLYANPPNGMTNVPINTNNGPWYGSSLGLLFNEPVASESVGNITLTPNGGSPMPIAAYLEYGNTIVWVQLPWSLSPNTQYTFNVAGVTDLNGNPASGATTSSFTTGSGFDFTQPTVVSTVPANGATTTGIPASVSLTMSEALNPVLITSSQFWLRTHNTQTTIPTTISISSSATPSVGTTVTLTPVTPLEESTIYEIVYWPNNWWPTDIAGNNLSNYGVEATFTTDSTGAVNGACGTAKGQTFSVPPTANLCSAGTVTGLTNAGGALSWSCSSQDGGTAASCSATVTPVAACVPQMGSLVSWWKGDDDATDMMGHNNGTLENGAGFALGAVNDAFSFDGSNQYVLIGEPVPADLQIQNAITLSAWIYPTAYPTSNGTPSGSATWGLIMGSDYNYDGASIFLNGTQNALTNVPVGSIEFALGDGSAWHLALTTTQVPLNQWTLVTAAATANNPMQVYFNGVAQPTVNDGTSVWTGTVAYSSSEWFAIGQDSATNYPFNGLIDEVQVYNTALSAAQVQGIYNAAGTGMCTVAAPSSVALSSSNSPVAVGTSVTITATITPSSGTGTVTFNDNTTGLSLGTEPVSGGQAAITTSALVAGTHNITASYSGDSVTVSSNSTPFYQSMTEGGLQCAYKPTSLIDWYPAEGNMNDTFGSVNGTVQGTIGYATGEVGQAFNFTTLGDVSTSLATTFNTASGTQFTVNFWMYWNGTDNQVVIGFPNYDLTFESGGFGFNTNGGDVWGISETGLANKWVLVTAVFNNGNVHANQLFINGVQQSLSQLRGSSPTSIQVQTPAYIGGQGSSYPGWYFNGYLDEVQFFNGALTPAQVQGIYNAGSNGVCQ